MSSHPLRLYLDADKTTQYTTVVTTTSTYTEITVASGAPSTLFYQCSIHANMGARITVTEVDQGLDTQFGGDIATVAFSNVGEINEFYKSNIKNKNTRLHR